MKKGIWFFVATFIMMVSMFPVAVSSAKNPSVTFTVQADKKDVKPGDEITFSVYVHATQACTGFQMDLDVPTGLTYMDGTGMAESNFKKKTKADGDVSFTEKTKRILVGSTTSLEGLSEGQIVATFKCKVDSLSSGKYDIGLKGAEVLNASYDPMSPDEFIFVPAMVEIVLEENSVASTFEGISEMEEKQTDIKQQISEESQEESQEDSQVDSTELNAEETEETEQLISNVLETQVVVEQSKEETALSDDVLESEEKTASWWWLVVLLVGGAGIGAVVYKKRGGENTK